MRKRMLKLTRFFPRNEFIAEIVRTSPEPDLDGFVQYGRWQAVSLLRGSLLLDRLMPKRN
jgi:hypothetical protein